MAKSTENKVVVEMTTDKALTPKQAMALIDTALSRRAEFAKVKIKSFERVISRMNELVDFRESERKAKRK